MRSGLLEVVCQTAEVLPQLFEPSLGDIYVDGSALHPLHPHVASAASAAVQLFPDGAVARAATAAVPLGWPQTAAATERLSIAIAAQAARGWCSIVSDCQSVVDEWHAPVRAASARAVWGGLWRQLRGFFAAEAECPSPEGHRVWAGKAVADAAAGVVAAAVGPSAPDLAAYEAEHAFVAAVVATMAWVLAA